MGLVLCLENVVRCLVVGYVGVFRFGCMVVRWFVVRAWVRGRSCFDLEVVLRFFMVVLLAVLKNGKKSSVLGFLSWWYKEKFVTHARGWTNRILSPPKNEQKSISETRFFFIFGNTLRRISLSKFEKFTISKTNIAPQKMNKKIFALFEKNTKQKNKKRKTTH